MKKSLSKHRDLVGIFEFIKEIEGLKNVLRHSWQSSGRRESTAEHTWRMAVMAWMLADYLEQKVDTFKVIKMILIHDLAEIKVGDAVWFKEDISDKHAIEEKGLQELVKNLPTSLQTEITALWREYDEAKTDESKFAKSIDKIEMLIQHNQAPLETWEEIELEINYWYGYDKVAHSQVMTQIRDFVLEETAEKLEQRV